jgi:gamma-glutamylcyclotransferase (GGCT)/AIG2-like uncharacterized protein YtfP
MRKVFVYGTLLNQNSRMMEKRFGAVPPPVPARLEGYALYGVTPDYPGVVPEPGGVVMGEVWDFPELALQALDYYEGVGAGLYRREEAEVAVDGGRKEKAFFYVWNREARGRRVPLEEQPWRPRGLDWEEDLNEEDWDGEDWDEED